MESLLLILVTGWLVWKYYTIVVARPWKAQRGGEKATYDQYENNLDGFPYRREADGSVLVLTDSGEVRYCTWKDFYTNIRPDYQNGEGQKRDAQERERVKQERAVERLRRLQQEQAREAERLSEQRLEQEREAERLREQRRQQDRVAEMLRQRQRESALAPSEGDEDWWTVLDVPPHADADRIQCAYHQKMKQCHPDRVAGLAPEFVELAERQAKRLNAAYRKAIQVYRDSI